MSGVEGATQLFAYEASRDYVYAVGPYLQSLKIQASDFQSPLEALATLVSQDFISNNNVQFPNLPLNSLL